MYAFLIWCEWPSIQLSSFSLQGFFVHVMFILPVMKDHLFWGTTKFIGCFIQVSYLGIEMSFSGSFKPAINRLVDKASKAYYILRQTFNFNNGCSPRVIQKLFNIMIVPILSYGAEIWACFGCRRQEIRNIKQFIFNTRHSFEKLQSKMCRNALGMNKNVPDHLVKAEMGAFPIMGFFIKRIFSYGNMFLPCSGKTL